MQWHPDRHWWKWEAEGVAIVVLLYLVYREWLNWFWALLPFTFSPVSTGLHDLAIWARSRPEAQQAVPKYVWWGLGVGIFHRN